MVLRSVVTEFASNKLLRGKRTADGYVLKQERKSLEDKHVGCLTIRQLWADPVHLRSDMNMERIVPREAEVSKVQIRRLKSCLMLLLSFYTTD